MEFSSEHLCFYASQTMPRRDDDHHQKTVKCSWFVGVEKRAVLAQVIMCFGDPRMMDKRRCLQVMRNLLYFLNQGQTFTKSEAVAVLFSATKLFRFEDLHLKRLVYLIAGELCPIAEEAVMLESALLLDLFSIKYSYKSLGEKAVRLLSRITNVPSSIKVEEYLKVAIKSPVEKVSSAGLVCALHLLKKDPGIGIKICEQVGTVAAESCGLQKFHALCLLSRMQQIETTLGIRELARPHIDKILSFELKHAGTYQKNGIRYLSHPLFACLVIRLITQIIRASGESGEVFVDFWNYMNKCWDVRGYHIYDLGNEMVAIEELYYVMQLRNTSGSTVEAAIEEVCSRLPSSHHIVRRRQIDRNGFPIISYVEEPLFFNVHRSMLKWSRIKNHLQPDDDDDDDDDDAQLAISKTQGLAPATHSLYFRKRMAFQY